MEEKTLDIIKINTESWQQDITKPTAIEQIKIELFDIMPENSLHLRMTPPEFDFGKPPVDPNTFASSLVETCKKYGALGLAANQCGFHYRVFVMGHGENYVAFFNPKILSHSEEVVSMEEGCLSFLDLFINIGRYSQIDIEYQDYTGEKKSATYAGITARIFQHELDHLNGIVYTERVKPLALQMAKKRQLKRRQEKIKLQKQVEEKVKNEFSRRDKFTKLA